MFGINTSLLFCWPFGSRVWGTKSGAWDATLVPWIRQRQRERLHGASCVQSQEQIFAQCCRYRRVPRSLAVCHRCWKGRQRLWWGWTEDNRRGPDPRPCHAQPKVAGFMSSHASAHLEAHAHFGHTLICWLFWKNSGITLHFCRCTSSTQSNGQQTLQAFRAEWTCSSQSQGVHLAGNCQDWYTLCVDLRNHQQIAETAAQGRCAHEESCRLSSSSFISTQKLFIKQICLQGCNAVDEQTQQRRTTGFPAFGSIQNK